MVIYPVDSAMQHLNNQGPLNSKWEGYNVCFSCLEQYFLTWIVLTNW